MTKRARWIWYPGDFEVWLGNIFNNRRTERGALFPPFWKQDSHWPTVVFCAEVCLDAEETISIWTEGQFNFSVDGQLQTAADSHVVPAGRHHLAFKLWNQATPPTLFVEGTTIKTDSSWQTTYEDKIWIDENGTAHGAGTYVPAGSWNFDDPTLPPSHYALQRREALPQSCRPTGKGRLYDFGRETFGHLDFGKTEGRGAAYTYIYYGESREEALDKARCETLDTMRFADGKPQARLGSKAFRYVYIETEGDLGYELAMQEEYAPFDAERSGSFSCSDPLLNDIWQTAARTLELTTQEFFMDGIKRDRWTWSGDAIQSYLMNYYLHFDTECVKRTIRQLRGKDPVTAHVNTIMDYTFYWFKSVLDYYDYTGDIDFVREMWPRMVSLMDYVRRRTNAEGWAEGKADDWIFVDWVDFPMHKRGTLCFEQILFWKALQTMQTCADLLGKAADYGAQADALEAKIRDTFWSQEQHAYLHALESDDEHTSAAQLNRQVTKFPNMFALLYGLASEQERHDITTHVMLNKAIPPITTPYMRFYELEALCTMGMQREVLDEIRAYWGGMLREGATTFWEKYNPEESGVQHLAMYGRPYGKSLCHAWGASPLYLTGRYVLGIRPTQPGYEAYEVRPCLGDLEWMEGSVPTPHGLIRLRMDTRHVSIEAEGGTGRLIVGGKTYRIEPGKKYEIAYEQ